MANALECAFDHSYSEVVLVGLDETAKLTFGTLAMCSDVYRLSCMRNPAVAYGLGSGSNLTFLNHSANKDQAQKVFFRDFSDFTKTSLGIYRDRCSLKSPDLLV